MLKSALIVGAGGFIGSALRYLVQVNIHRLFDHTFPMGTFVVNIIGSFIIGALFAIAEKGHLMSAEWRIFFAVGICGGFTTFSAFTIDNLNLIRENAFTQLLIYTGGSLFLGVLAVYLGMILTRSFI